MCEVEEQQAVRVEAQPQKRRAVIRVESEEPQDDALERRRCGPGQEEVEETGFVPSAVSEPVCALHLCDKKCSEQGFKYFQLMQALQQRKANSTGRTATVASKDIGRLSTKAPNRSRWYKPQFNAEYPEAVIREGAEELTLRAEEVVT